LSWAHTGADPHADADAAFARPDCHSHAAADRDGQSRIHVHAAPSNAGRDTDRVDPIDADCLT